MPLTRRRRRSGGGGAAAGPTTYISDGFGGAAATLVGRTPDTAGATTWSVITGTFNTNGTQATCTTGGLSMIDAGHADATVQALLPAMGGDMGLLFRGVDNLNYWYWVWQSGFPRWNLTKVIGNVATIVLTTPTTPAPVAGDTLKLVLLGNQITGFLNATQIFTVTDAQHATTGTKHGLAGINASTNAWDNFLVTS